MVVELPRDPETGKRRQRWVTVRGTKRDAERVLTELLGEVERGCYVGASPRLTVGQYLDQWMEATKIEIRETTHRVRQTYVRYIKDLLGSAPLVKLTPLDVQRALNRLPEHLAPATKADIFKVLRAALRRAVAWNLIPRSPTDGVKFPVSTKRDRMTVWTEEQVSAFLNRVSGSRYYPLFHTAVATGMRLGELLGLTWDDVDLVNGVVHVCRSLALDSGGSPRWHEPKTKRSRRRIPLDPVTVEVLRQHRKKQLEERLRAGPDWHDYNLVFATDRGKPLERRNLEAALKRFARSAGLPVIRFHDLRHTHATILLRQGVHPKVVSERLGHSTVSLTLDVYSHVLPDTQQEATRAIERVFGGKAVSKRLAT